MGSLWTSPAREGGPRDCSLYLPACVSGYEKEIDSQTGQATVLRGYGVGAASSLLRMKLVYLNQTVTVGATEKAPKLTFHPHCTKKGTARVAPGA